MSSPERYIRLTQEWAHAATLFGRLNGTDWSVLMVVAHHTWGLQRESAELGLSVFCDRCNACGESIRTSVARLTAPRTTPKGFGMIRVVQKQSNHRGRILALETDWALWAWEDEQALERCAMAMMVYRKGSKSIVSDYTPSADAVDLATMLRQHCVGLVPQAEVPTMNLENRLWFRWLTQMDKLLEKFPRLSIEQVIRFAHNDSFWTAQIFGENADLRLERNFSILLARVAAKNRQR